MTEQNRQAACNQDESLTAEALERLSKNQLAKNIGVQRWHENEPLPPKWLIDGLLHERTINLLDGLGSSGKSILAQQLAMAVAAGNHWLEFKVMANGPVIYLNAEDPDSENQRRYLRIMENAYLSPEQIELLQQNLTYISLADILIDPALVTAQGKLTTTYKQLLELVRTLKPVLVVIDPLVFFSDGNENDNTMAKKLYTALRGLNTTILLIHHMSKAAMNGETTQRAKSRGSSVYTENARTRMSLEKGVLTVDKNNYGKTFEGSNAIRLVMDAGFWRRPSLNERIIASGGKKKFTPRLGC